tara:strand:- start:430 stop:672 length:243 start_codon:yes stop_codon:yes gene_type:complete
MARFIIDVQTKYDEDNNILTDIRKAVEVFADENLSAKFNGGVVSATCIEKHNTAQFHEQDYRNNLTTKQIKTYNKLIKGE